MEYVNPLGEEKVSKLLLKFSLPAIVGMLVNALYNIVDRLYIGNSPALGANGIAGITIGFPIMIITMAIGVLFGIGGATLFSLKLGQKQNDEAENALGNAFSLLIIGSVLYTVISLIFLTPLLKMFGASDVILPYATEYMSIIMFGATFQVLGMGLNHFIRADGNPKIAMMTMFFGAGTNIILDPIFIYVFDMGMAGAAIATVISQIFSAIWVIYYFLGKKSKMKLKLKYIKLRFDIVKRIVSLGLPGSLMQLSSSLLTALLNKSLIVYGGDLAISGMGIINSIQTLFLMPVIGINQGVQPIISFNFGAKKYDRVRTAEKYAIIAATITVTIGAIITRLFPEMLVSFFNKEPNLVKLSSYALKTWFMFMPLLGFQILGSTMFQAIGKYKTAMFLNLSRQVIFLIPAILIFPRFWGFEGLLHSAPFSDLASVIITATLYFKTIKNLEKEGEALVK